MDIAVDGGQSGLRVATVRDGHVVDVWQADGFAYAPIEDAVGADARVLTDQIARAAPSVRRVCLGLTNAPHDRAGRLRLAEAVRHAVAASAVLVTADMVTAHSGALAGSDGVVVAAGTGAVCFGTWRGACARSDGFGYLLGDDGSGYAVGRAGLRAALRAGEGRGPATVLTAAARSRFEQVPDFPHGLYRRPRVVEEIASFARDVAAAADAGDAVACDILSDAVDRLVTSAASVVERCPGLVAAEVVPVSYTGGLFTIDVHVRRAFAERMVARVGAAQVVPPDGDALAGAVRLLAGPARRYGDLVAEAGAA